MKPWTPLARFAILCVMVKILQQPLAIIELVHNGYPRH